MRSITTLIIGSVALISSTAEAQSRLVPPSKWKAGVQTSISYSASGHGHFYEAKALIGYKRTMMTGGMVINRNGRCEGVTGDIQLALSTDPTYEPNRPLLYAFVSGIYRPAAKLCRSAAMLEEVTETRSRADIDNMRLQTVEGSVGFGMKVKVVSSFYWTTGIGFGGYHSLNCPTDMYHQRSALGLLVRTGLYLRLK